MAVINARRIQNGRDATGLRVTRFSSPEKMWLRTQVRVVALGVAKLMGEVSVTRVRHDVELKLSRPGMQDDCDSELDTQPFGVFSKLTQGVGCAPEQQGKDLFAVGVGNRAQLAGQCEDDMKMRQGCCCSPELPLTRLSLCRPKWTFQVRLKTAAEGGLVQRHVLG